LSPSTAFIVPGQPVGKPRPRFYWDPERAKVAVRSDPRSKSHERDVALLGRAAMRGQELQLPVRVELELHLRRPKRLKGAPGTPWAPRTPDVDNVAKLIMDALTGPRQGRRAGGWRPWKDDAQVVALEALKVYHAPGGEPLTRVRILEVLEDAGAAVLRLQARGAGAPQLWVPGAPPPQDRPRVRDAGPWGVKLHPDPGTEFYASQAILLVRQLRAPWPLGTPVAVDLVEVFPRPSGAGAGWGWYTMTPDVDNVAKAVLDGLGRSRRLWADDQQVTAGEWLKVYGPPGQRPGTLILARPEERDPAGLIAA